jgi:ethanolamine-phosphate cytidylyltransferase
LVVGVASDEEICANKGPTILNIHERAEIIRHCKFVDEVQINVVYTPTIETLNSIGCGFYAHGDDPCIDKDGVDVC